MASETVKVVEVTVNMVIRPLDGIDPMQDTMNIINGLLSQGVDIRQIKAENIVEFNYVKE